MEVRQIDKKTPSKRNTTSENEYKFYGEQNTFSTYIKRKIGLHAVLIRTGASVSVTMIGYSKIK